MSIRPALGWGEPKDQSSRRDLWWKVEHTGSYISQTVFHETHLSSLKQCQVFCQNDSIVRLKRKKKFQIVLNAFPHLQWSFKFPLHSITLNVLRDWRRKCSWLWSTQIFQMSLFYLGIFLFIYLQEHTYQHFMGTWVFHKHFPCTGLCFKHITR